MSRRPRHDPAKEAELRRLAHAYLTAAVRELAERGEVEPQPEWLESPAWMRSDVADGYANTERDQLAEAIRSVNPERFASAHARARQYSEHYPRALLRALVTGSRVNYQPIDDGSDVAASLVDELVARATAPLWTWRTVNVVADLDAEEVDGSSIHGVTVRAVRERGTGSWIDVLRALSPLLPEAAQELQEQDVFDIAGRVATSLLHVTDQRGIPEREFLRDSADLRLTRVLTAARLATAATVDVTAVCRGEPFMVHQTSPEVTQGQWEGGFFGSLRRPLRLTETLRTGIERLSATLESAVPGPLQIALSRYTRSHRPAWWYDRTVDLAVAIEAALIGEKSPEEITLRVCSRAAHLLATDTDSAGAIFDDVKDLYALRSEVVHGGTDAERIWRRFTDRHGFTETLAADAQAPGFDRFRDLARRAILARLLLRTSEQVDPVWPDRAARVDRAVVEGAERERWRSEIRRKCEVLGVPNAWREAGPMRDLWAERKERRDAAAGSG